MWVRQFTLQIYREVVGGITNLFNMTYVARLADLVSVEQFDFHEHAHVCIFFGH